MLHNTIKRILCFALVLALLPMSAISSGLEYAAMTDEQLVQLDRQLAEEMAVRGLYVYVSLSGSKYHSKPTCGNMKHSMGVSKADAEGCAYEPCGRCYKQSK